MSASRRPILISVMQYEDELDADTLTVSDVIARAARFGVDGIEIRPQYWRERGRELPAARELLAQHGLLVTYATTTTLFSADPEDAARLRGEIDDARSLGAPQLRVFQGPAPDERDEAGWTAGRATVEYAAARGVTLALENYPECRAARSRVGTNPRSPARPGGESGHRQLRAPRRGCPDGDRPLRRAGGLGTCERPGERDPWTSQPLGAGELHLPRIMAALEALPQRLIYCFEFRGEGDPDGRIERSLAYLRERAWEGA
jgi:sugar phosphate isomerase/epimerase